MSACDDFAAAMATWTEGLLRPYLERLQLARDEGRERRAAKEFNDPVWGTVVLHPYEVLIVDSPLVQRLRRVRQLGVVHLVYPAALHTRFEHSIGAMHQVQRIMDAVDSHTPDDGQRHFTLQDLRTLRLAALCHDVGHGAMSHVSETAVSRLPAGDDVIASFADAHAEERSSLSEIAAHYILASATFDEFLRLVGELAPDHLTLDGLQRRLADVVLGRPISDEYPLLSEIISGPFDCDKLDYMTRDALMSGVPLVTDVPRLVQKVRAVRCAQDLLPLEIARTVTGGLPSYSLMGIDISGGRTLDELILGQTLLRDKLYRHQKVRAAEAMVGGILEQLASLCVSNAAGLPYVFTDDELVSLTPERIAASPDLSLQPADRDARIAVACDLATRFRDRNLFVRCFAFAQNMPLDAYRSDPTQYQGLQRLARHTRRPDIQASVIAAISQGAFDALRILGGNWADRVESSADLAPYIRIDPPQGPHKNDTARALLMTSDHQILRFREDAAETPAWSNAYLLTRDIGYIFAPDELSDVVYLATERYLRTEYEIRAPTTTLDYSKRSRSRINELRRRLTAADYYAGAPRDLLPLPARITRADVPRRVSTVVNRTLGYEGPVRDSHAGTGGQAGKGTIGTSGRILDWAAQFESDQLVEAALDVLDHIQYIGRGSIVATMSNFLSRQPQFRDAYLVPLGEPKDSSTIITYYATDLAAQANLVTCSLEEALGGERRPIVFADDFIGSGGQSVSIVEAWLGAEPTADLHEVRPSLREEMREEFAERTVAFVFSAGTTFGADRLRGRTRELGLDAEVEVGCTDLVQAFAPGVIEDAARRDGFRLACEQAGFELLKSTTDHDDDWCRERALGYGNHSYLVVFPYNTPTQTLTALWSHGEYGGRRWEPVFPRRKKT